ncbi:MAG: CDP-alcohol phosphatidyltransferase family protein [Candidatus Lokiarchaeota archaeon]
MKKIIGEKLSANQLTLIGLTIGLLAAFFVYLSVILPFHFLYTILACIFLVFSFTMDTMDGVIARSGKPSQFGGILDIFSDRTVEIFIIISIVSTDPRNLIWPGLFSLGAMVLCISMFLITGVISEQPQGTEKVIYYSQGIVERSETLIILFLLVLLIPWRFILLWIFALLVFLTAILRLRDAYIIFKK